MFQCGKLMHTFSLKLVIATVFLHNQTKVNLNEVKVLANYLGQTIDDGSLTDREKVYNFQ